MVWPFSPSEDESSKASNGDPMRDLDPSLRAFLEKESPVKYKTSEPQPQASTPPQSTTSTSDTSKNLSSPTSAQTSSQSLYPDGRYAHLWSTYRPLEEIEAEHKTDQEKLLDVIQGYKQRKASIGRAALENCALEQMAMNDCWAHGGAKDILTICRAPSRKFERCYVMQARFLKALGYLNTYERPVEIEEQIQMHADTLYHRMLDQESAVAKAKAEGLPIPTFPPMMSSPTGNLTSDLATTSSPSPGSENQEPRPITIADLQPSVRAKFAERLKGLSPQERELEEKAINMEITAGLQMRGIIVELREEADEGRKKRQEQGKQTFGDRITTWFRFI